MRKFRLPKFLRGMLLGAAMAVPLSSAGAPAVIPRELVGGLVQPVEIVAAGDGSARLFVVEQVGRVRIVENKALLPTPFLDVSALISVSNERGLLGLAFHPDYGTNRAFYVFYTAPGGNLTVARYLRSLSDPRQADPASGVVLLSIPHTQFANHNGGKLAFGPDGFLYIGTGDGGSACDPQNNSQNFSSLLGKILRIEVDAGTQYRIPEGNPFAANAKCPAGAGPCPEIWAYGLRNPWKFTFDRTLGGLFIGDVGQNRFEEVNFLSPARVAPANFGWKIFEATQCANGSTTCALGGHVAPVIEYAHDAAGGVSVTGGYRYRGFRNPSLKGWYVYGDFGSERIWTVAQPATGPWAPRILLEPPVPFGGLSSFGEDNAGELYLADYTGGKIWSLDPPLTLSSQRLTFPRTAPGAQSAPRAIRLTNAAVAPFGITSVTVSGDFAVSGNGCSTLTAGAFCDISVHFTPTAPGARTGELVIGTNYPGNPVYRVPLSGNRLAGPSRDLDGNGREDVHWRSAGGTNLLWNIEGSGTVGSAVSIPALGGVWAIAASADLDGDGVADLFLRNSTSGQNAVWLLRAGGLKQAFAATPLADLNWKVVGSGDTDGDGRADIVWRHDVTGENMVWRMNGGTVLQTLPLTTVADAQWRIVATGDLDGDGMTDLVWRHGVSGNNRAWFLNGRGVKGTGILPAEPDANWRIGQGADFNGDGKMDLAWRNQSTGANRIWLMDGATRTSEGAIASAGLGFNLSGAGDYDGDGKADLFWTNAATGANAIWLMNGFAVAAARSLPKRPAGMNPVP